MKKILIAEDDSFLVKVYSAKIPKAGYELRIAKDGEEVLSVLKDYTPDIILLDIIMPKKDGFTVLKELRADDNYRSIPVIITSNLGQAEDKQKAKELGAIDYMVKSDVQVSQIIEKIQQILGA